METEINLLGNVIEFSIGLGGFSGVVAVFMNRSEWNPLQQYRLVRLLMAALVPAFASFIALGFVAMNTARVIDPWQLSCATLTALVTWVAYTAYIGRKRIPNALQSQMRSGVFFTLQLFLLAVVLVNVIGTSGIFGSATFLAFYFGLITLLVEGVVLFGVAIVSSSNRNSYK